MRRIFLATLFLLVSAVLPVAASPQAVPNDKPSACDLLRASKSKAYGFHPAQLNESQIDAKGKELEAFWKQVRAAGPDGAACLKVMLTAETTDHNFQFDAGEILYQMDPSLDSLKIVRDAIAQADFQETDPANYLSLALALSQAGVDIQPLAARLLRYPNATIHISEHALDLDADTAALFLYGSMPPAQATNALIAELQAPELFMRSAAAHLLAEQLNEGSFRTLSRWDGVDKIEEEYRRNDVQAVLKYQPPDPADFVQPEFTREQVLKIIASLPHTRKEFDEVMNTRGAAFDKKLHDANLTPEQLTKAVADSEPIYGIAGHTAFLNSAVATLLPGDFKTLQDARRKALFDVSDESLEEYLAFTQLMIRLINKLDLYKDYRAH
ncbi:MAG TPA: hypothetical protein VJY15_10835 [Candidatus Acidoferrum sp.]|nr:hypothetical protein [Candidatus Acidoferrum sp.]